MKEPDKMYVCELRYEVRIMRQVNDGLVETIKQRDAEIERLKAIDKALYDYKGEIAKAEYRQFQQEGADELIASRRRKRYVG